jgi:ABC-type transport system involved in multi-copper enzyme maturation permease subunit
MIGPVYSLEILLGSRRGRQNAFRRGYAGWLIVQFSIVFAIYYTNPSAHDISRFVNAYFQIFLAQHFILLLVATPVFVAGALTDEKAAGTLQYLLTADLTSWEIVIGKLFGRITQVFLLCLVGLPVLAFVGGYGHLNWPTVFALALLTLLVLFLLGSASLWASVRSTQTREAVLRVYRWLGMLVLPVGVFLLWGVDYLLQSFLPKSPWAQLVLQVADVLNSYNPLYLLDTVWGQDDWREFGQRFELMLAGYGGLGLMFLALSVWRLRPTTIRQMEGPSRRPRKAPTRRPIHDDPIRWREQPAGHRLRRWVALALTAAASSAACAWVARLPEPVFFLIPGGVIGLGLSLVAGVRASGSVTSERERHTWDSLLLTPLDTWDLVVDKQRGTVAFLFPYLLAHGAPELGFALSHGAAAVCFVLSMLLLNWVGMHFMAATGVWCSVSARGSWRSLVASVASGYGYCLAVLSLFAFVNLWLGCTLVPILSFVVSLMGVKNITLGVTIPACLISSIGMAWFLWRSSEKKIALARAWVDANERYGRTFVRSLANALRKRYLKEEEVRMREATPVAVE